MECYKSEVCNLLRGSTKVRQIVPEQRELGKRKGFYIKCVPNTLFAVINEVNGDR